MPAPLRARSKRPRLLLADDHAVVVEGLRKLLESEFDLVDAVYDGKSLIASARKLKPDIILLDISMPLLNGIDAARRLRKIVPESKLIFLTMHADPAYVAEAVQVGASGYVVKRSAASELVAAIRQVVQGKTYFTPLVSRVRAGRSGSIRLTPRQRETLQLVAEGRSNKEIAALLNISVKTVEFHKATLMQRLGLHTAAELTQFAVKHGLIAV